MANVKGSALASRVLWVRLNRGEAGITRLLGEVSPSLREGIERGPVMARWYPFEQFIELNLAIDRLFGQGDLTLISELGKHGADANLTTIYKLFYRVGTVRWILSRAVRLWGMHYDSGRLVVRAPTPREAELEIVDFAEPHRAHCLSVFGWALRSIELSGSRVVASVESGCRARGDDRCRFRASWE